MAIMNHGNLRLYALFPDHPSLYNASSFVKEANKMKAERDQAIRGPPDQPSLGASREARGSREVAVGGRGRAARGVVPRTDSAAPAAGRATGAGPSRAESGSLNPTQKLHSMLKQISPSNQAEKEELAAAIRATAPSRGSHPAIEKFHSALMRNIESTRRHTSGPSAAASSKVARSGEPAKSDNAGRTSE